MQLRERVPGFHAKSRHEFEFHIRTLGRMGHRMVQYQRSETTVMFPTLVSLATPYRTVRDVTRVQVSYKTQRGTG
jgi:hypothetical protein